MGIFGNLFDFNRDGKLDPLEKAMDFGLFLHMVEEIDKGDSNDDFDDDSGEFDD